jgi:hypothetical protein
MIFINRFLLPYESFQLKNKDRLIYSERDKLIFGLNAAFNLSVILFVSVK